jgi:hypothetical protein
MLWDGLFKHVAEQVGAPQDQVRVSFSSVSTFASMCKKITIKQRLAQLTITAHILPACIIPLGLFLRPNPSFTSKPRPCVFTSDHNLLLHTYNGHDDRPTSAIIQLYWNVCHCRIFSRSINAMDSVLVSGSNTRLEADLVAGSSWAISPSGMPVFFAGVNGSDSPQSPQASHFPSLHRKH